MKKLFFSLSALLIAAGAFAQTKADDVAKFTSETIEMGKLKQNNPTTATFTVKNIGKSPLIIETASPTCGCTIGDYTKSPIAPGETGKITATYNAANLGNFEKHMTVKFAGVDEVKSITIKGEVLTADDFAKLPAPVVAPVVTTETKTKVSPKTGKKTTKTKTKTSVATASH